MKYDIILIDGALADIDDYLSVSESIDTATDVIDQFEKTIRSLAELAERGPRLRFGEPPIVTTAAATENFVSIPFP